MSEVVFGICHVAVALVLFRKLSERWEFDPDWVNALTVLVAVLNLLRPTLVFVLWMSR